MENSVLLMQAVRKGDAPYVAELIREGHASTTGEKQALMLVACTRNHSDVVKVLLDHGADVHAHDDIALMWAIGYNSPMSVKHLLEHGANARARKDDLMYPLWRKHFDIAQMLLDHGADIDVDDGYGLYSAVRNNELDTVHWLLERGASVHINREAALRCAVEKGHFDVVKALIEHGANARIDHDLLFAKAVEHHRYNIADLLIASNREADIVNSNYGNPLTEAVERGDFDAVKWLVSRGADVNIDESAPIRYAVNDGNRPMVMLLHQLGSRLTERAREFVKPIDFQSLESPMECPICCETRDTVLICDKHVAGCQECVLKMTRRSCPLCRKSF